MKSIIKIWCVTLLFFFIVFSGTAYSSEKLIPAAERLNAAAFNGDIDEVRALLDDGADIEHRNKSGWTPFDASDLRRPYRDSRIAA